MDHIQGLGFCKPLFDPNKEIHIWGPGGSTQSLQARLNRFLSPPLFPIPLRDIPSKLTIHELPNAPFTIGKFTISADFISHPGPTVGYRVTCGDKTMTYMPDHEPMVGQPHLYPEDCWVSGFGLAYQTDLLIHDSQYDQKEYKDKIGWGHSTLNLAVEFSIRVEAKKLLLFHHDPSHSDAHRIKMYKDYMQNHTPEIPIELAVQGQEIPV
jgi:ribonuclease BN (tRNA processing enzyme)